MKKRIEFEGDHLEDKNEFSIIERAEDMYLMLSDIRSLCRQYIKYGPEEPSEGGIIETIYERVCELEL